MEDYLISQLKLALIYDDGTLEKIFKDKNELTNKPMQKDDDAPHIFYMKDFLKDHFTEFKSIQSLFIGGLPDINTVLFEISQLGNIAFAENTSYSEHPTGIFYLPPSLSKQQILTMQDIVRKLNDENYKIAVLYNLYRDDEGMLSGSQKTGDPSLVLEIKNLSKSEIEH